MAELARRSGYPADLVEPLLAGNPVFVSEEMNKELCEALSLDPENLWNDRPEANK